ncbi:hypothetical protein AXF42_Ash007244 [Apostasia shenzhenica]|uniref:Short-chain dehydrogenase TIC 32, chloroplastic n=1 Tax=Apostasia shenzhenica TaxID=1088818 RepID=A0A2I0B9P3_9ASPA|nr:hypothetical protein AXF42_Ash007244 [Apostasia shenzhenica]
MFLQQAWRKAAFGLYGFTQFTRAGFQEHSKRFKEEDMQISMEGKNVMVTGANSGIGFAAAEGLASRLEMNFAVNVAATYAMTELMMPLLEKAAPDARVITVSSGVMYTSPLVKDLQYSERNFDGIMQYARNKRIQCCILCRLSGRLRTSEEGADTIIWLAMQPKERLLSGAFYFDRAEAPKHLALAGTAASHSLIDAIVEDLRSITAFPPPPPPPS